MKFPLENIRIIDLSRVWAGPYATKLLADLGAEVVKLEVPRAYDTRRGPVRPARGITDYPDGEPGERPWNRNAWFNSLNLNKLGITLDLGAASGREAFLSLAAISDVVIESYRFGVLDRLGVGYQALREARPDIILVSMPAFGASGPWKRYVGYGVGQEQLSGMAHLTGYPDSGPKKSGLNHGDPITATHAVAAILGALLRRRRTGQGAFIDVSHMESSVCLVGEHVLGFQLTGRDEERRGNRDGAAAPQGVFPCLGEDSWVTISVAGDAEWHSLCQVMGQPELAVDPEFADSLSRWRHQDRLDEIIRRWTRGLEAKQITEDLQRRGVAAAPALSPRGVIEDPQFKALETFQEVTHPEAGTHLYPGAPWRLSGVPRRRHRPAPLLGEHNEQVYRELLALSDAQLARLEEENATNASPD